LPGGRYPEHSVTALAWWEYATVALVTTAVSLVLTPLLLRLALRVGVLDHPGSYKTQTSPVPYLGGLAIVVTFTALVIAATALRPPISGTADVGELLSIGVALSLLGLLDDIRGLSPWLRLGLEVMAGIGVYVTGTHAELVEHQYADAAITVLWVVGITNAFNLLDNMDGLSA